MREGELSTRDSPVLTVEGLTVDDRTSDKAILTDIGFTVYPGEFLCLTGPSGSGKSTLALALMRLLPDGLAPTAGRVRLGDVDLLTASDEALAHIRGKDISIISQDPLAGLNPVLRCGVQVEEPLRLHTDWDRARRREAVLSMFARLGLDQPDRIYRAFPTEISGGQRQRVMMAMAALLQPRVLIADEPTTALDRKSAEMILDRLSAMRVETGTAILLITHDLALVRRRASRTVAIDRGRMGHSQAVRPSGAGLSEHESGDSLAQASPRDVPLLEVRELAKSFRRSGIASGGASDVTVLDGISIEMRAGEIVGLVGASGEGKTTVGRCIAGLESPDRGAVLLNGLPLPTLGRVPHPVQVVYQSPYASLNPIMPIGRAIEEGMRSLGTEPRLRRRKAVELLKRVGLPESYYARMPRELSGGERQRVVIARCLAAEPKLLIADEPTASLDDYTKWSILGLLREKARELRLGILLISHDIETVSRICDRALRLEARRLSPVQNLEIDGAGLPA